MTPYDWGGGGGGGSTLSTVSWGGWTLALIRDMIGINRAYRFYIIAKPANA